VSAWLRDLDTIFGNLRAANQITPAQEATLRGTIAALQGSYQEFAAASGASLATLPEGRRGFVVSYTNAGDVVERGIEMGLGTYLTREVRVDGGYTLFDFDIERAQAGDSLKPNTPRHKGTASLQYHGRTGVDVALTAHIVAAYDWAAGVYAGRIPPSQTVDLSIGFQMANGPRLHAVATNVFNQQRYHIYGGSVIGRRVVAGLSGTF
jgi:outer membrane receptor protein involved in Fe transport